MRALERGMSLVEILVAVAIGMIGILIITQAYISSDTFNRSTLGEGGAQTSGTIALFTIERDLRMAGYGINSTAALGCGNVKWFYSGTYSANLGGTLPNIQLAPVVITQTAGQPDQLTVMYSTDADRTVPTTLAKNQVGAGTVIDVDGLLGFRDNDMILLVSQAAPGNCTLNTATSANTGTAKITMASSAPNNPPGGGLFPAFQKDDLVFNLGTTLVRDFSIFTNPANNNRSLRVTDRMLAAAGTPPVDIVEDIVDLRAQYGKDDGINNNTVDNNGIYVADDGIVDGYSSVTPATAAQWQQVLSVRVAVLARIGAYERTTGGACTATTATPTWAGSTLPVGGPSPFVVTEGLPSCYRYRVFETVIPLRNMIWRQS